MIKKFYCRELDKKVIHEYTYSKSEIKRLLKMKCYGTDYCNKLEKDCVYCKNAVNARK